jgi:hypothetical protein
MPDPAFEIELELIKLTHVKRRSNESELNYLDRLVTAACELEDLESLSSEAKSWLEHTAAGDEIIDPARPGDR